MGVITLDPDPGRWPPGRPVLCCPHRVRELSDANNTAGLSASVTCVPVPG